MFLSVGTLLAIKFEQSQLTMLTNLVWHRYNIHTLTFGTSAIVICFSILSGMVSEPSEPVNLTHQLYSEFANFHWLRRWKNCTNVKLEQLQSYHYNLSSMTLCQWKTLKAIFLIVAYLASLLQWEIITQLKWLGKLQQWISGSMLN